MEQSLTHLVQNEGVEVRHVPLVGHWAFVVILEVFLQSYRVVRDLHQRAQVVGQHLRRRRLGAVADSGGGQWFVAQWLKKRAKVHFKSVEN